MPLVTLVHVPIYSQVLASQLDISLQQDKPKKGLHAGKMDGK